MAFISSGAKTSDVSEYRGVSLHSETVAHVDSVIHVVAVRMQLRCRVT